MNMMMQQLSTFGLPFFKLVALTLAIGICLTGNGGRGSASVLQNIPGAELMRDLTYTSLDTFNKVLEGETALGEQVFYNGFTSICPEDDQSPQCEAFRLDPDTNRNVTEIIRSRKFEAQEYDVITKDGYILTIQRIINPLVDPKYRPKLKPVIMQHGLMSSSVDWVINSFKVRPAAYPKRKNSSNNGLRTRNTRAVGSAGAAGSDDDDSTTTTTNEQQVTETQEHPNALGFYMANEGYDVFLANSRGNIYGQRHVNMSSWEPKFWDFSFDEQIKYDLPATIEFVQKLTNHTKLGYVGHSQGTAMMFGLMSEKPQYADIIEPFVALAPVAYVNHAISPVKYFSIYTPVFEHMNMWFATSNAAVKYLGPIVCGPQVVRKDICSNIIFLGVGFNEDELDESRISAYLSHMPSGTSVKNIAHYGQEVLSGRFAHFDHGLLGNQMSYGQAQAPDYDLSKIRSNSIALFTAENDWLASPKDVARLRQSLRVKPMLYNITEQMPKWNHIDFVYGKHAGEIVNTRILEVFKHFNNNKKSNTNNPNNNNNNNNNVGE